MYCWTHIKTLEFPAASLTLRFPNENLYTFPLNPKAARCQHRVIFLNYIPPRTSVEKYKFLQLFVLHIPAQSYQPTLQLPISVTHSTLLWNILSVRAIEGFRHEAADVRVTLGYEVV